MACRPNSIRQVEFHCIPKLRLRDNIPYVLDGGLIIQPTIFCLVENVLIFYTKEEASITSISLCSRLYRGRSISLCSRLYRVRVRHEWRFTSSAYLHHKCSFYSPIPPQFFFLSCVLQTYELFKFTPSWFKFKAVSPVYFNLIKPLLLWEYQFLFFPSN